MAQRKQARCYGGWVEKKVIGNGGFGTVMLWEQKENGLSIALKQCRLVQEMQEKHKQRWQMEIQIMLRLDHPNIIHAYPVPEPLLAIQKDGLPMLAMEFCTEGDLRNVLNKAENCCGLQESQVRDIAHDVGSGIEYLHMQRIIHRDLKPENIVLQKVDDRRVVYKLIDLGYAKDMDQGSVCTSFVGTLQYLAPELFQTKRYSATVDYWSFGTLIFECIVGFRPFLHGHSPAQWQYEVSSKRPEAIYAYLNDMGTISFSNNLPQPNLLCIPSRHFFEEWLRLMLRWDPRERGGPLMTNPKRHKCFIVLDKIIELKILYIMCVRNNLLISMPIEDASKPLSSIQADIEKESGIPVALQEFLFVTGMPASTKSALNVCWTDAIGEKENCNLFLFRQDDAPIESLDVWKRGHTPLPPIVTNMIRDASTLMMYQEQRKVWGHVVFYASQTYNEYDRLLDAEVAARMYLIRMNTRVSKLKNDMISAMSELSAKISGFLKSVQYDLQKYEEQTKTGITSRKMVKRWEKQEEKVNKLKELRSEVEEVSKQYNGVCARVEEMERSPYSTKTADRHDTELAQIKRNVMDCYYRHRQIPHEERNRGQDNRGMVSLVLKCKDTQETLTSNLHAHFSTISKCMGELRQLEPTVEGVITRIKGADSDLMIEQQQRQRDMWYLVSVALKINQNPDESYDGGSLLDLQSMPATMHPQPGYPGSTTPEHPAASASFIDSAVDLSITNNRQLLDSLRIPQRTRELSLGDWSFIGEPTSPPSPMYPPPPAHHPPYSRHAEQLHHGMPPPASSPHWRPPPHTYINTQGRTIPSQYVTSPAAAAASRFQAPPPSVAQATAGTRTSTSAYSDTATGLHDRFSQLTVQPVVGSSGGEYFQRQPVVGSSGGDYIQLQQQQHNPWAAS